MGEDIRGRCRDFICFNILVFGATPKVLRNYSWLCSGIETRSACMRGKYFICFILSYAWRVFFSLLVGLRSHLMGKGVWAGYHTVL